MHKMGYPTNSTIWPSTDSPPGPVKQLIDNLFSLVDQKGDNIGKQLSRDIFTEDGVFVAASGAFRGAAGM